MKVYVVTQGEYSDYRIEKVFTDRDKAELFCATLNDDYCALPQIEEFETDEVKIEGTVYRYVIAYGSKYLLYNGEIGYQLYNYEIRREITPIAEKVESKITGRDYRYKIIIPVKNYITLNQAHKIAKDRWDKFVAEQKEL